MLSTAYYGATDTTTSGGTFCIGASGGKPERQWCEACERAFAAAAAAVARVDAEKIAPLAIGTSRGGTLLLQRRSQRSENVKAIAIDAGQRSSPTSLHLGILFAAPNQPFNSFVFVEASRTPNPPPASATILTERI